jgi:hypothetical protein
LDRRNVRLTPPGEKRYLETGLELLGGERVVLNYDSRLGRLAYENDRLTTRNTGRAQSLRAADNRKLLLDALDPERVGPTINRFHFRVRDEDFENRFTPRPRYVWLELTPRSAAGDASDQVFPCIDASFVRNTNLPIVQMPVDGWPESPKARVQSWFRYTDPVATHQAIVPRGQAGQTLAVGSDKWRVEQTGGEPGIARKITVIWEPREPAGSAQGLFDRAVWASPQPDTTRRHYSVDGSAAIHEFIYSRADAANEDVRLRIVSRTDFQQGAYFAEFDFDLN